MDERDFTRELDQMMGKDFSAPAPLPLAGDPSVDATGTELPFFAVSTTKLFLMSLCTLGVYELYWLYQNWKRVGARGTKKISPFWRAVAAPIFCYPLFQAIRAEIEEQATARKLSAGALAAAYLGLSFTHKLPDPYWLVCFLTVLPLMWVQACVNEHHAQLHPGFERNARFGFANLAGATFGSLFLLMAVLGALGPDTKAIPGSEVSQGTRDILIEQGFLAPEEKLLFFYSAGFFSVREEGNFFTDRQVVSYEIIDGESHAYAADYAEIEDIDVTYGNTWLMDTEIQVRTHEGEEFLLLASAEEDRDRAFVQQLLSVWRQHASEPL